MAVVAVLAGAGGVSEAAPAPARIERIRYSADGNTTRVIVMLSRPVPHEVLVLPGDPARGSERRLVLDFSNARLGSEALRPIGVEDGLLLRIRTGQFTARTARVVMDLARRGSHSVDVHADPPRVVVDIVGRPVMARPAAPATGPEPPSGSQPPSGARTAEAASDAPTPRPRPTAVRQASGTAGTEGGPGAAVSDGSRSPRASEGVPPAPGARHEREAAWRPGDDRQTGTSADARRRPEPWRIVLDPGHGGSDPGARGVGGVLEKDVVLAIARMLKTRLEQGLHAEVLLTRSGDVTRSLADRTAFANANSADLFISIHANADLSGQLHGVETYTLNNSQDQATIRLAKMENGPAVRTGSGDLSFILSDLLQSGKEEESIALAERLQGTLVARLRSRHPDVRDLGVKKGPFYVLVGAYMPCVLVETSFLSHPVEGRRLATAEYQAVVAEGLYRGVADFLGDARLAKTL